MSAGNFVQTRYESNADTGGGIYPIRVQPETLLLDIGGTVNSPPAAPADQPIFARARKGTREYGVGARAVRLRFTPGSIPTGYSGDEVVVPIMTAALFANATPGSTGTYLSAPVTVVSRLPERVR